MLNYAYGEPPLCARLRASPEDFRVSERLGFEPDGDGEHVLLWVRKRSANTAWVAEQLASFAGLPAKALSYSGLKDRDALTEQWFSAHLPSGERPWLQCQTSEFQVLRAVRHGRKLRRGSHTGNDFSITLRELSGPPEQLQQRVTDAMAGVPNYFGPQRFGRGGANLSRAEALFAGQLRPRRQQRGLYLSAARAELFNRVLAARVGDGSWQHALPGEALQLAGSHSYFVATEADTDSDQLSARLASFDIHPSGPLWGRGDPPCVGQALALEQNLVANDAQLQALAAGLADAGLNQERRALRLIATGLRLEWLAPIAGLAEHAAATLHFSLPSGCFATALLRELVRELVRETVPPAAD